MKRDREINSTERGKGGKDFMRGVKPRGIKSKGIFYKYF
jgi:hypothetical protein